MDTNSNFCPNLDAQRKPICTCAHIGVYILGSPHGSDSKESASNAGGPGLIPGSERSPGEGHGNPLQCSCLENPRDGGAWWAAVYGVAQSRIWLKWLSRSSKPIKTLWLNNPECRWPLHVFILNSYSSTFTVFYSLMKYLWSVTVPVYFLISTDMLDLATYCGFTARNMIGRW